MKTKGSKRKTTSTKKKQVEVVAENQETPMDSSSSSLNSSLNHDHDYASRREVTEDTIPEGADEPFDKDNSDAQDHSYRSSTNHEPPSPSLTEPYSDHSMSEITKDGETSDINLSTQQDDPSQSESQVGLTASGAIEEFSAISPKTSSADDVSDSKVQGDTQDGNDDEIGDKEVKVKNPSETKTNRRKKRRSLEKDTESEDETTIKG